MEKNSCRGWCKLMQNESTAGETLTPENVDVQRKVDAGEQLDGATVGQREWTLE